MADSVRVRVPATSANLGPAYDCMGLALDLWDEVGVEVLDHPGVQIDVTGRGPTLFRMMNLTLSSQRCDRGWWNWVTPARMLGCT